MIINFLNLQCLLNAIFHRDLSSNDLKHIPTGTFDSLQDLELLDLSNNQLTLLATPFIASLGSLQTLDLSMNRITSEKQKN